MERELLLRGKRDPKPLLLKLGFALALSIAGFFACRLRFRPPLPPPPEKTVAKSSRNRATGIKDELRILSSEEELAKIVNGTSTNSTAASSKVIDELWVLSTEEEFARIVNGTPKSTAVCKVMDELRVLSSEEESANIVNGASNGKVNDEEFKTYPQTNPMKAMKEEVLVKVINGTSNSSTITYVVSEELEKEKLELEKEAAYLRNLVEALKARERTLEVQLLEYHGLKEQVATMRELENRVKINATESKLLHLKIDSLQADNQKLQDQVSDYTRAVADLKVAREEIKVLKRRLMLEAEDAKEKFDSLSQRITELQDRILKGGETEDVEVDEKSMMVKELDNKLVDLQKVNSRLAEENLKLVQQLDSTNMAASSTLENKEAEVSHLREENDRLKTEIEQLQTDRCADVEELVYLRWVNACLRYELRNYQPPQGKTVAKDLGKSLSPKSEQKAKQLILEYAHTGIDDKNASPFDFDTESCSSSRASSEEFTDTSIDISSSTKDRRSSKSRFLTKLRKLVLGKDKLQETPTSCGGSSIRASISPCSLEDLNGVRRSFESISSSVSAENEAVMDSLEIERRLNTRAGKNNVRERSKSDLGTSRGHMRVISEDDCLGTLFQDEGQDDSDMPEKAKLKKFADVFRGPQKLQKSKRLASFS